MAIRETAFFAPATYECRAAWGEWRLYNPLMRTVFVSGASGFVGTAVVAELLRRGCMVHAAVRSRDLRLNDARVTCFRGNLDDTTLLDRALERCSDAIHLVGIIREDPRHGTTFHRLHVDFTRVVVDACIRRGVQRYVHMSALGAHSDSPTLYHQTKAAAEQIVEAGPLSWTILRPSLIHGPEGEFVQMLARWAKGKAFPFFAMPYFGAGLLGRGPEHLVQPVSVDDVAWAFAEAVERPATIGKRYDLGGAQRLSWREMYRTFSQAVTGEVKRTFPVPAWYALLLTRIAPAKLLPFDRGQVIMSQQDNVADLQAFEADFGRQPEGFEQTLAKYAPKLA